MSTTETCLTAHLAMPGSRPDDAFLMDAAGGIRECFGIGHTTLRVETSGDTACVLAPARIVRATPGGWGGHPDGTVTRHAHRRNR